MSQQIGRVALWVALIATSPFLLLSLLWCLFLVNTVNPMQLTFVTSFEVENGTQQVIWITPVGTIHPGRKAVLPQFMMACPAIPAWRSRDLRVDPGARRRIYYDWDDINFSEILIRDERGVILNDIVDPAPPTDAYYANRLDLYRIDSIESLPPVSPSVEAALAPNPRRIAFRTLAIGGLVAPVIWGWLWRRLRRGTQNR